MYYKLIFQPKIAVACLFFCSALKADAANAIDQPITFNLLFRIEFLLDHPPQKVWPYIIDRQSWITGFSSETVEGEPGHKGEVIKIIVPSDTIIADEYFAEVVKVIDQRQVIVKYLPSRAKTNAAYSLSGYDVYDLEVVGGKTRVTFQTFQEYRTADMNEMAFRLIMESASEVAKRRWREVYIPALTALLQQDIAK